MQAGSRFGDVLVGIRTDEELTWFFNDAGTSSVEGLVGVRAEYLHAHMTQRTNAASTTAWLEELIAKCSKDLVAWRCDAFRAVEQAVKAYPQARGKDHSVVPPEEP